MSMPAQFVNISAANTTALGAGGLARHKRAELRDEQTLDGPRAGIEPVPLVDEAAQLGDAFTALEKDRLARVGKRGRRPAGAYNILMTGPPRYDGENGTPLNAEQEIAWAKACQKWLEDSLPDGVVIAASYLHRDESSPHVHATIIPWSNETQCIDWRTVRARMAGEKPRAKLKFEGMSGKDASPAAKAKARKIKAADRRSASEEMKAILDSFHSQVSAKWGIEREKGGKGRRHRAVDRRVSSERDAEAAAQRAAQAEARAAKAREAAKAAATKRETEEEALAAAQVKRRTEERERILSAEEERRAELEAQEAARAKLEGIEAEVRDAIAVGTEGGIGKRAKRGREIRTKLEGERDDAVADRAGIFSQLIEAATTAESEHERGDGLQASGGEAGRPGGGPRGRAAGAVGSARSAGAGTAASGGRWSGWQPWKRRLRP